MNYHLPRRSRSLRDLQATRDSSLPAASHSKSPSLATLSQPTASKYQIWPLAKSPVGTSKPSQSSDKVAALAAGRSATSLSDTAVLSENSVPFWQRTGSLSRRRKVSVPELGNTMTTVQEMAIDSRKFHCLNGPPKQQLTQFPATIPGRPPLRKHSYEAFGHERSCSAPGTNWRSGPFGDAMMVCVTGPSSVQTKQSATPLSSEILNTTGKPLSPILSPGATPRPLLKVETENIVEEQERRPQVPPKSPAGERKGSPAPLVLNSKASKPQLTTPASTHSGGGTPLSAMDLRRSPNGSVPLPTPPSAFTNPFYASSPASTRGSPRTERRDPIATQNSTHNRNVSESSIMDRGRPKRRNSKKERSRTMSESDGPEAVADSWKLPQGMRVPEASRRISDADQKLLHKQAYDQAGNFEVLNKRDVASLSRVRFPRVHTDDHR